MNKTNTKILVRTAMLSALALILSFWETPVPIFPSFLKFDLADLPAVIGAITLGPIPAVMIVFIKNILKGFISSSSAGVGEVANFLIGGLLILPLGIAMRKNKTAKNFAIGAVSGIILMIISASILNVYVLLPMYEVVFNFPTEQVIAVSNAINPKITDLNTYILWIVVPFNLIKGALVMGLGYLLYIALRKPLLSAN